MSERIERYFCDDSCTRIKKQKHIRGETQRELEHALARSCCISYCASMLTGRKPLPPFWPRPSRPSC